MDFSPLWHDPMMTALSLAFFLIACLALGGVMLAHEKSGGQ